MLRQEELAFIKVLSNEDVSPAHMVETYRSSDKESGTETGNTRTSPEQEKRPLRQERCSAV